MAFVKLTIPDTATRAVLFMGVVLVLGAPAFAADIPLKAAPAATVASSWEGAYFGGHIGYSFDVTKFDASTGLFGNPAIDTDFLSGRGVTGGLLAGYNHMLTSRLMVGLEGDVSWSALKQEVDFPPAGFGPNSFFKAQSPMSYAARIRAGFLVTPETMLFGSAGWARGKYNVTLTEPAGDLLESYQYWVNGLQVGGGAETRLAGNWSARLEYLHTFYQQKTLDSPLFGALQNRDSVGVGRLALIYRPGIAVTAAPGWNTPQPAPSWTGFYAGGAVGPGIGSTKVKLADFPGTTMDGVGVAGIVPAALVGYNYRFAQRAVVGIESETAPGVSTTDIDLKPTIAVRGRLGYLLTPSTMAYGTAGWVTTGIKTTTLVGNIVTIPSQRVNALQVGGGIETALTEHWLVRIAYQYASARSLDHIVVNVAGGGSTTAQAHPQWQYGELGAVYLF